MFGRSRYQGLAAVKESGVGWPHDSHGKKRRSILSFQIGLVIGLVSAVACLVGFLVKIDLRNAPAQITSQEMLTEAPSPEPTPNSTSQPAYRPQVTSTPLPIPATGIVWNRKGSGTYLFDHPGGAILDSVPNGTSVSLTGELETYGQVVWAPVVSEDRTGYIDFSAFIRPAVALVAAIRSEGGVYLYDQPKGKIQTWLPPGSPLIDVGERVKVDGRPWAAVTVFGGVQGWVLQEGIQPNGDIR